MTRFAASLALLMMAAAPVAAQGVDTIMPRLTWPDDSITASTKSCVTTAQDGSACPAQK